jgi:gamma-glutamylcysteine synthetase
MISMPMVRSVQTVLQPCTDTNTISKWTTMRFHTTHVTYEFHRVRLKLFMCLWYVQRKLCAYVVSELALSPNGTNRAPPDPRRLRSTSGASKTIYDPMVHLTQTKHLSCTDANTVSKQIETRFHMTHVTSEFHRVAPILFLSQRYVRRKPCTNLASRESLSPNGPNRAST